MYMNYLTIKDQGKNEKLVAVAGEEKEANYLLDNIDGAIETHVRTLDQLFDNKVEIPKALQWIVDSDAKFQKKVIDDRMKNLCPAP